MRDRGRPRAGQAALAVSVVALIVAIGGTALGGGSRVPGKGGVKASDVAKGAIRSKQIRNEAVAPVDLPDPQFVSLDFVDTGWEPNPIGAGVAKDALGFVHLRGQIGSSGIGSTSLDEPILVLPARFRPAITTVFPVGIDDPDGLGQLQIEPNGVVTLVGSYNSSYAEMTILDGITYLAADPNS
jgi:hypothetical protein